MNRSVDVFFSLFLLSPINALNFDIYYICWNMFSVFVFLKRFTICLLMARENMNKNFHSNLLYCERIFILVFIIVPIWMWLHVISFVYLFQKSSMKTHQWTIISHVQSFFSRFCWSIESIYLQKKVFFSHFRTQKFSLQITNVQGI